MTGFDIYDLHGVAGVQQPMLTLAIHPSILPAIPPSGCPLFFSRRKGAAMKHGCTVVSRYGGPEVLEPVEDESPEPGTALGVQVVGTYGRRKGNRG
jgi:hypothetical protein